MKMQTGQKDHSAKDKTANPSTSMAHMAAEYKNFVTHIEELVKSSASLTGDELTQAKEKINQSIAAAKVSVEHIGESVSDKARKTGSLANSYAHDKPWPLIGASLLVGYALGFLVTNGDK